MLALLALPLVALMALPSMAGASASAPTEDMSQEQVVALTSPSVVYIQTSWAGWVGIPNDETGSVDWYEAPPVGYSCSGFVASPDGYIGTAGHCVDPTLDRSAPIIDSFLMSQVEQGVFTAEQAAEIAPMAYEQWIVEGFDPGSDPALVNEAGEPTGTATVVQTVSASGIEVSAPMEAQVVELVPYLKGDVALLKVDATDMPALELAAAMPETGETITAIGSPASVQDAVDPGAEPSYKSGTVSSHQTQNGAPYIEHSAPSTQGMSGGPAVNGQGQVVGVNSQGTDEQPFNLATGTDTLSALFSRNGVPVELSETDAAYRAGLNAYFAEDYDEAVTQLDTVLAEQPNHAQAQKFRADAAKAAEAQGGSSSPMPYVLVGLMAITVAAIGGVVAKRHGRKPEPPAPMPDSGTVKVVHPAGNGEVLSGPNSNRWEEVS